MVSVDFKQKKKYKVIVDCFIFKAIAASRIEL